MGRSHRYIISDYAFKKHNTLELAQVEKKRLQDKHPKKTFIIYKVKKGLDLNGVPKLNVGEKTLLNTKRTILKLNSPKVEV